MRITSGKARAISLKSPKGDSTRPATDAARQAVFSSLGSLVEGASVLDLFAGTGSYGLEALSRGAKSAVFVENGRMPIECLKLNIEAVKKAAGDFEARILRADCLTLKPEMFGETFDLIFADAPYPLLLSEARAIFEVLKKLAGESTLVVLEAPGEFEPPQHSGFEVLRRLGKSSKGKPSQLIMQKRGGGET